MSSRTVTIRGAMTVGNVHGSITTPNIRMKRRHIRLIRKIIILMKSTHLSFSLMEELSVFSVRKNQLPVRTMPTVGILIQNILGIRYEKYSRDEPFQVVH